MEGVQVPQQDGDGVDHDRARRVPNGRTQGVPTDPGVEARADHDRAAAQRDTHHRKRSQVRFEMLANDQRVALEERKGEGCQDNPERPFFDRPAHRWKQ